MAISSRLLDDGEQVLVGCGTLVVSDAGELGLRLPDIPRVEETQLVLSRQLYRASRLHDDA